MDGWILKKQFLEKAILKELSEIARPTVKWLSCCFFCVFIVSSFLSFRPFFTLSNNYLFAVFCLIPSLLKVFSTGKINNPFANWNRGCISLLFIQIVYLSISSLPNFRLDILFSYLLFLGLLYVFCGLSFSQNSTKLILSIFIYSGFLASLVLIFQHKAPFPGLSRMSIFFNSREFYDPNFLAAFLFPPCIFSFIRITNSKKITSKFQFAIVSVIIFSAIILTGSRGSLLTATFCLLVLIFSDKKNFGVFLFLCVLAIILLFLFLPMDFFDRFFYFPDYIQSNERRLSFWGLGFNAFLQRPWLGNGMVWSSDAVQGATSISQTAHSSLLTLLIQFGCLGTTAFLAIFFRIFKQFYCDRRKRVFAFFFLGFLAVHIVIESTTSLVFFVPLILWEQLSRSPNGFITV